MKFPLHVLTVLLALLVTACPRLPGLMPRTGDPVAQSQQVAPLQGTVDFSVPGRTVQASIGEDISKGATVGLIETSTGYTVATTFTDKDGNFSLKFANSWKPTPNTVYYMEAVKGLSAGTTLPNRVGADLARVRTLIVYQDGQWLSTSGLSIRLNPTSTALAIILSLRSMTPAGAGRQIAASAMIGIMDPNPGTATTPSTVTFANTSLLPPDMVTSAYLAVLDALAKDSDPFRSLLLDTTDPLYNTLLNAPRVVSVAALNPAVQTIGGTLDVIGSGFSATASENVVEFSDVAGGPVSAPVASVSADLARLTVTVPSGAVTGPIAVTVGGRKIIGPRFYLALQSGHEALISDEQSPYNGSLFVANETFGTLARISPQGQITTFFPPPGSGLPVLTAPRALTLRNGKIYVTCAGSKKGVVVIDLASPTTPPVDFGTSGVIADPRGIAYDSAGTFFVSDGANNKIYRIDTSTSTPTALTTTGDPLSNPRGIAFGSDGLYVANYGANNVLRVNPTTGAGVVFKQGFSFPWGVAFDSVGNLYVSNNKGNSIYRWEKSSDTLAPYATMPSPGGVVADRAGYIYAVDNTSNNLYRITPLGDSSIFASGVSSPTGIAKVGNILYVLSATNNSLMTVNPDSSAVGTLARGFNNPHGLAYDADRDCFYVGSVGNGTIARVDRVTGGTTTVLTGLGSQAVGIAYRSGRLYVRSGGSVRSYDVTNFANPTVSYATVMNSNLGVAKDTSGSANAGSYYIATGGGRRILRIVGDGTGYRSLDGNNRMIVFKENDANLTNPRDVAVDGSGNVWVINQAGGGGSLLAYRPDGSLFLGPITTGINNPLGLNITGTKVWVANYDAKTVTSYDVATGTPVDSLSTGANNPRNLCFFGNDLYLVTNAGVGRIANYATAPAYGLLYTATGAGYNDIEVKADGSIYVTSGGIRKILPDLSADVFDYPNYNSPNFFWQDTSGELWITDSLRFTNRSTGGYAYRLIGSANGPSGGQYLAGVDSNGNVYLNGTSQCSHDVVARIKAGPPQEEWTYDSSYSCDYARVGSFSADNVGNFYYTDYKGLYIKKVDASGAVVTLSGSGVGREYTTKGSWIEPDGSVMYQSVTSHHRIDKVTISGGTATRITQPYGLSAAEM